MPALGGSFGAWSDGFVGTSLVLGRFVTAANGTPARGQINDGARPGLVVEPEGAELRTGLPVRVGGAVSWFLDTIEPI